MKTKQWIIGLITACSIILLGGCSSQPSPTLVDLSMMSGMRQNLATNQTASPVVVEIIELRRPDAFTQLDFFSLFDRPQKSLGSDYVAAEKHVFVPRQSRTLKLRLHQGSKYLGVVAAYQNINDVIWQQLIPLAPEEKNSVVLTLTEAGVSVLSQKPEVGPVTLEKPAGLSQEKQVFHG